MLEGIREDYLEKEINKICAKQMFGEVIIEEEITLNQNTSELSTTEVVVYKPKQSVLQSPRRDAMSLKDGRGRFCANADFKTNYDELNDRTTTLYSANPSLILPSDEHGNSKMLEYSENGESQYLHIVLPTSELNILNSAGQAYSGTNSSSDPMFVEIGCKIFEINHIKGEPVVKTTGLH